MQVVVLNGAIDCPTEPNRYGVVILAHFSPTHLCQTDSLACAITAIKMAIRDRLGDMGYVYCSRRGCAVARVE